jgi:uncharacterized membrane protein HdeD (DUF308 family)
MSDSLDAQYDVGQGVGFWIQVIRALLLLTLGLSLLFVPDKTHKMLFNAMGLFWLTTSLVLIRREARKGGNRLWLVVAIFGVLAGLLVITRDLSRQWVAEVWVKGLLGALILLTGVLQTAGLLSHGRRAWRGRPLVDLLLGLATIFFGALLIVGRTGKEQIVYYVATVWALLGGGLILYSAGRQWFQERQQKQAGPAEEQFAVAHAAEPDDQSSIAQAAE